jgi:Flp pilus assembly pilin Flp
MARNGAAGRAVVIEDCKERQMRRLCKRAAGLLRRVYRDEQGANMLEYVLIIAAVALPVLAIVLLYRNELMQWVQERWRAVTGTAEPVGP